ncbi:IS5/IS1182 family transposase [Streptomyces sp. SID4923]|nr:IS5/IS1182 family transposase [Streptomyces sp. SID4923]
MPASSQGIDARKKIVGRKWSIATDTLGLLLAVLVTAAAVQDSVAGTHLLNQVAAEHPSIGKVWVDDGYRQYLVEHAATLGINMEITARKSGTRGFTQIPTRWAVERTYGWLMLNRRLAHDCETLPIRPEALLQLAMTSLMTRRLTGENTISWRAPKRMTEHPHLGMKHWTKTSSEQPDHGGALSTADRRQGNMTARRGRAGAALAMVRRHHTVHTMRAEDVDVEEGAASPVSFSTSGSKSRPRCRASGGGRCVQPALLRLGDEVGELRHAHLYMLAEVVGDDDTAVLARGGIDVELRTAAVAVPAERGEGFEGTEIESLLVG